MVTLEFSHRFKNKLNKIGKAGLPNIDPMNSVKKSEIPLDKIHAIPNKLEPHLTKSIIANQFSNSRSKSPTPILNPNNFYSSTNIKIKDSGGLPLIENFTNKNIETGISRSKSPIYIRDKYQLQDKNYLNSISFAKLPRIIRKK